MGIHGLGRKKTSGGREENRNERLSTLDSGDYVGIMLVGGRDPSGRVLDAATLLFMIPIVRVDGGTRETPARTRPRRVSRESARVM